MKKIILNKIHRTRTNYKKYFILVDDKDFERVNKHNWFIQKIEDNFYAYTNINRKHIAIHKFLTNFKKTDHIDGNGLNNQRSNLRGVTNQQNRMNSKRHKDGSSKYKGVYWDKSLNKWRAKICINSRQTHIGLFFSEENAGQAYNFMAEKLFGEYARFNK